MNDTIITALGFLYPSLTGHEQHLIAWLLDHGPQRATILGKCCNVPRTKIYDYMKKLKDIGLVITERPAVEYPANYGMLGNHARAKLHLRAQERISTRFLANRIQIAKDLKIFLDMRKSLEEFAKSLKEIPD